MHFRANSESQVLSFVKQFCEIHGYDMKTVAVKTPLTSSKLKDHLDPETYKHFQQYEDFEQSPKLKPIVEAAYYLNFRQLIDVCLVVIGCPFYCGDNEQEQELFK